MNFAFQGLVFLFMASAAIELRFEKYVTETGLDACVRNSTCLRAHRGKSKLHCSFYCQRSSVCRGFNYYKDNSTCHYFGTDPGRLDLIKGCISYKRFCGTTVKGLDPSTSCAIPFTYKGKLYYQCIDMDQNECTLECFDWKWKMRTCSTPNQFVATYSRVSIPALAPIPLLSINNWTVIQSRPVTTSFMKTMSEYEEGFFMANGYWVGLTGISQLTSSGNYRLRVEVQSALNDTWYSAEYSNFSLGNNSTGYKLYLSNYVGDANDPFYSRPCIPCNIVGYSFHTWDFPVLGCEHLLTDGGWWMNACAGVHLNADPPNNVWLYMPNGDKFVKESRMMIKWVD